MRPAHRAEPFDQMALGASWQIPAAPATVAGLLGLAARRAPGVDRVTMTAAVEAAVALALRAFRCGANKSPAIPGRGGHKHATADPKALRALWRRRHPGPLVGVPTDETSGFHVFDVEAPLHPKAAEWWAQHRDRLPPTRVHSTRSGGLHVLFRYGADALAAAALAAGLAPAKRGVTMERKRSGAGALAGAVGAKHYITGRKSRPSFNDKQAAVCCAVWRHNLRRRSLLRRWAREGGG